MKHLATLFTLIWFTATAFGQFPKDEATGKIVYTDVIELPELDKKEVYDRSKLWVLSTLKSADNVIELDEENSDRIIATGNIKLDSIRYSYKNNKNFSTDASLNFKFLVFCRDGKLKYSVENFMMNTLYGTTYQNSNLAYLKNPPWNMPKKAEAWREVTRPYVDRQIKALIADFERAMNTKENKDW